MPLPAGQPSNAHSAAASDLILKHGDGPGLIVLLHAAGSGPRALDRFARALASPGWATLAPAFERGARSMIDATADAPFAEAVAFANTLIERHPGRPRLLFGHSMGGLVALNAALAGAPADALVLYEPIVLSLLDPGDPEDCAAQTWDASCIADFRASMAAANPEEGVRRFIEAYGDLPWDALPQAARSALVARADSLLAEAEATNAATLDRASLAGLPMPVLLLRGARSPGVLGRMARRLAATLPAAQATTITDAGHMGPVTHAREVAETISRWRAERWP